MDDQSVDAICAQITEQVVHITADKMYDTDAVFQTLDDYFPNADIVFHRKIIALLMRCTISKG
ncbi:hypothetical protein AFI02nite_41990 [Aliivibrio fischeri]|nr:hypothetical protein AFI02nite_41990 [Aliivibrio fischeri]